MIIKVTGLFQNPQTKLIYLNPILIIKNRIGYPGILIVDVDIVSEDTPIGNMLYHPEQELNKTEENIHTCQYCEYIIMEVKKDNHINSECVYTIEN